MDTDKHGLIGRAGSPLPAANTNAKPGAHEATHPTCDQCFHLCPSVSIRG
jgi:Pyruvate/2-oxoacid:ferredoxin oxidoreductase delta subunit